MTTLADLTAGQAFMFVAQVTAIDTAGTHVSLFGPASAAGGNAVIAPDGTMTGQLTSPPTSIPVQVVTQFAQVTAGDVLSNDATGETVVARAVTVQPDGSYLWSPSPSGGVVYGTGGWTIIGHVSLLGTATAASKNGGRVDLVATLISQAPLAAGALLIVYLLLTGVLVTGKEFNRLKAERDKLLEALELERQALNETAQAASVTNRLISAVVDLAADRQGVPRPALSPAEESGP